MDKSVLDITDGLRHQKQRLTTSDVRGVEGTFVVKLRAQIVDSHFLIHNYLWMKIITILKKNRVIWITRKQWKNYMILVEKIVISLMLMFLFLVMDVVCLNIFSFLLNISISIRCYHVHIYGLLMVVLEKS